MLVDQDKTDGLLKQATNPAVETAAELALPELRPAPADPELARILKVRVPVIVQLATRRMPVAAIRKFATGAIIEFEKSLEEDLDLLINNHLVGRGMCIKIGDNFGLWITEVANTKQRIRSMGT